MPDVNNNPTNETDPDKEKPGGASTTIETDKTLTEIEQNLTVDPTLSTDTTSEPTKPAKK